MTAECPHTTFCTDEDPCPKCMEPKLHPLIEDAASELVAAQQQFLLCHQDHDLAVRAAARAKNVLAHAKTRVLEAQRLLSKNAMAFARGEL